MKLNFDKNNFNKLKSILNCKDNPSELENNLIKKTYKYINYIKWIPGIQMVAVGNSVSMNSANLFSDIDLFIITSPNRIWIVRIITTIIFQFLGVRKTENKHKERFCLSFFCTTNALNFEKIALKNDIYLYFWIVHLKPILNYNNTFESLIKENKKWCNFQDYEDIIENNKNYILYSKNNIDKFTTILNIIEKVLKYIFIKKTRDSMKKEKYTFGIIVNDDMLKFHNKDIRKEIIYSIFKS